MTLAAFYGMSPEKLAAIGAGYSASADRLVLPVRTRHGIEYVLRAVGKNVRPKYLVTGPKDYQYIRVGRPGKSLVLVEDVFSMHKVAEVCQASALLGTSFRTDVAMLYLADAGPVEDVYLWFDNDAAGMKAQKQAEVGMTLLGFNVCKVRTQFDPKRYSRDEIEAYLRSSNAGFGVAPGVSRPIGIQSFAPDGGAA